MCNHIITVHSMEDLMTEDQVYRRRYRNALVEIKRIVGACNDDAEIFKRIANVLEGVGV